MKIKNVGFTCFYFLLIIATANAQSQPGLHVAENQTVLFGKDTTSAGSKLMWHPIKAAIRAGKANVGQWSYDDLGPFSAAFGLDTEARGNYSSAFGLSTWAFSFGEMSVGRYSVGGGDPNDWIPSDVLFEVGNGASNGSRSNALTVRKNGNIEVDGSIQAGKHEGSSPQIGAIQYNPVTNDFEGWNGSSWQSFTSSVNSTKTVFIGMSDFTASTMEGSLYSPRSGIGGAWITPSDSRGENRNFIRIPLNFPKNTVITNVEIIYYDNDDDENLMFEWYIHTGTGYTSYAPSFTSSGASNSAQTVTFGSTPFNLQFNGDYYIRCSVVADSQNQNQPVWGNESLKIGLAKIDYIEP